MRRRHRLSRRRLLQGALALALSSFLSGCEAREAPRIGFWRSARARPGVLDRGLSPGAARARLRRGQNIVIEYRFSEDRNDRLPELAAELVDLKVELILASGSPASFAAKQATRTIPIVMGASPPIRSRPDSSPAWRARAATSRG